MDEMELRISELEDRIEALEKLCGSLGVRSEEHTSELQSPT